MADLEEIRETFEILDEWESRYEYIIELGKEIERLPDVLKTDRNLVRGCQSRVWLIAQQATDSSNFILRLDSDAHIVRGLIAIVLSSYANKTAADVAEFQIESLFDELGLLSHLSPTRGNGLRAMIARVRSEARAVLGE